jgi:hypothetical protein
MSQDEGRYSMDGTGWNGMERDGMGYNGTKGYYRYHQNDLFTLRQSKLYQGYPNYYKTFSWLEASIMSHITTAELHYQ